MKVDFAWRHQLAPEVDPHVASFLGRSVARMPGPVWSLAAVQGALGLIMAVTAVTLAVDSDLQWLRVVLAMVFTMLAVTFVLRRDRGAGWLLHLTVDVTVVLIGIAAATAPSPIRMSSLLMFLVLPAVYAATWFPRSQMAAHLLVVIIVSGAVVLSAGLARDAAGMWVALIAVTVGTAYFINALVANLNRAAVIDSLTGLLNRAGLRVAVQAQGSHGAEHSIVATLDVDGLKALNDTQGHAAGDRALAEVGAVLRSHLRPSDVVARVGGDEFVLVLRRTDPAQAGAVIERMRAHLPLPVSAGWVIWEPGTPLEEAIQASDRLMYQEKSRNRQAGPEQRDAET